MKIINIQKGEIFRNVQLIYAQVEDGERIVFSSELGIILDVFYKDCHKIDNYEDALHQYIQFNKK